MPATRKGNTLEARWARLQRAIALERPDRTPVVLEYSGFAASVTDTPLVEFLASPEVNLQTMIEAFHLVGTADAINYGSFWPYGLCYVFLSKVKVPGVDLPADDTWQVVETELMTLADYDRILEQGWPEFQRELMAGTILKDVPAEYLPPRRRSPDIGRAWRSEGIPVLSGGNVTTPVELLCGSRSLERFALDLVEVPDKVEAVMDAIVPHLAPAVIGRARRLGHPCVWVGGWRGAPSLLSPAMWNRFVWRYFSRLVHEVVESGLVALLHLDSDWTRELDRFKELPRGRCIMALDGETDIFRAKEILGEHMCLMGDVPASLLYLGTPDQVHEYCSRLIRELGPTGFILQSGCDIPANAKLENVRAMVDAATP